MRRSESTSFLIQLVTDRRVAAALGLGFSSGIPVVLVYATQSAWLYQAHVPLGLIGLMGEMTLAYKFKFLWAPFLDRYDPPLLAHWLGRRRGWILVAQLGVMLTLAGIAFGDPGRWIWWTVAFSMALGFAGATQDVVIDGWRINVAPEKQPVMSSWTEIGWRVGTFAAGAGALILSDHIGWRGAYLCMAALMMCNLMITLLAPEPELDRRAHETKPVARQNLVETIIVPVKDLAKRLGPMALPILVMVAGFRLPGYVSGAMETPLFKSLHYSNTDIATVTKLFGFWLALAATFAGGWIVPRIGMMPSLFIGTVFGSSSHLALAWLAAHGDHAGGEFWFFAFTVGIDSFAYAFASIVLITYMSTIVSAEMAGSQFALLTSLVALPGSLLASGSGYIIDALGFTNFFVGTALIGVPTTILCWWVWRAHALTEVRPAPAV